jgi:hypothetical protein
MEAVNVGGCLATDIEIGQCLAAMAQLAIDGEIYCACAGSV